MGDRVLCEARGVAVEAGELLDDVRAHVAVLLLDVLGRLERRVGLAAVAQQRLHKVRDVAAGDGDRLDRGPDHVALGHGDDVRDAVARVDDGTCQGPVVDLGGRHEAASARTACTAMYRPAQLKDSKKISAVFSRFSGGFNGCGDAAV